MIENRKCKTLSIVKDFQNFLVAFFCAPYTFPLCFHAGEKTRGEGTFSKTAVMSVFFSGKVSDSRGHGGTAAQHGPAGHSALVGTFGGCAAQDGAPVHTRALETVASAWLNFYFYLAHLKANVKFYLT